MATFLETAFPSYLQVISVEPKLHHAYTATELQCLQSKARGRNGGIRVIAYL